MVDWKDGAAAPNYFTAAPNTKTVGAKTAAFLKDLGVDYKKIHCIGHSLGAHVNIILLFECYFNYLKCKKFRSRVGSLAKISNWEESPVWTRLVIIGFHLYIIKLKYFIPKNK